MKRTRLNRVSKNPAKVARRRLYEKNKTNYMEGRENRHHCERCGGLVGIIHLDLHHRAGRAGENYTDPKTFAAVCRPCHDWIHSHPREARATDWMD